MDVTLSLTKEGRYVNFSGMDALLEKLSQSSLKLGIIAGGQLAKMLIQEASKWDIETFVLDADPHCPAASIAHHHIVGSHLDYDAVYAFGKTVDILTFEIESVNINAIQKLKAEGVRIAPDPSVLEIIQDKGLQKAFYVSHKIPTAAYSLFSSTEEIHSAIMAGEISYPFVQKLRKGGYDGRGVAVIESAENLSSLLQGPSVIEKKVAIEKEIAMIVARNKNDEVACFPIVEMMFDPKSNMVDTLFSPSSITPEQSAYAMQIAQQLAREFKIEGLLAIEFFIDSTGSVLVNEVAPRPHNSGHHTIESVVTSQFEQHLRAIVNFPLGSVALRSPSVMVNIVGEQGFEGPVYYEGIKECLGCSGVFVHLYGKKTTRAFRKMGHATILAETVDAALETAQYIKKMMRVISCKKN